MNRIEFLKCIDNILGKPLISLLCKIGQQSKEPQENIKRLLLICPGGIGEPYYPVPMQDALNIYDKYKNEAQKLKFVYFVGRLAEYKYYNMDQAVKRALEVFEEIARKICP
ncbi:MAG: UDP-galactopyranose mutase [Thermodesulfovibrionales bacterium]